MDRTRRRHAPRVGGTFPVATGAIVSIALLAAGSALCPSSEAAEPPNVPWSRAGEHVGEDVVVEGWVVGVRCSERVCHLAFEPTSRVFAAVVRAEDFDVFPPEVLEERYSGHPVRIRGRVVRPSRRPEIVLRKAEQLELLTKAAEPEQEAAPGEEAELIERQTELLARLTTLLERIEALTDRLAATEERLATTLDDLARRDAELQSMLAAMAPPAEPPPPPAPRPRRYETLRSIKRGMSSTDVERLLGQPSRVEYGQNGWAAWYYEPGRSISFNSRGRVEAFVGFPR